MKRIIVLFLAVAILFTCTACSQPVPVSIEPEISQMRAICEIAVMECYYHNVGKFHDKEAAKGFKFRGDDSLITKVFCLKADYASSENTNNVF